MCCYCWAGLGSLTKKIKVEEKQALSTPQSAPHSSKMCAPKIGTLENNTTTPTLPQGAAAERQHHLQKKDVCHLNQFLFWVYPQTDCYWMQICLAGS